MANPIAFPSDHLADQTAVVTGASSGIGLVTAQSLAAMGARVLLVCRSPERAAAAQASVAAGATGPAPEIYLADLSRPEEVRDMTVRMVSDHPEQHILVNNAGFLGNPNRIETPDGMEITVATNHLGYVGMAAGLLPALRKGAAANAAKTPAANAGTTIPVSLHGARIVQVSSAVHRMKSARFDPDDLAFEDGYSGIGSYARTKLMNVLFTRELANRLQGTGITVNALHPGTVYTGVARTWPSWFQAVYRLGRFVMIDARKGARTSIYLASSPAVAGQTGGYYVRCKPAKSAQWDGEPALREALWDKSAVLLGLSPNWT